MQYRLTPRDVRELALQPGRVLKDPRYHARDHHFGFPELIAALRHCFRVRPDAREHGRPTTAAFWADCHFFRNTRLRIDFNLATTPSGNAILIVTAFRLEDRP